jgi:hypothetical protein
VSDEQLVEIYRGGGGNTQAELIRAVLAGSGIDCVAQGGWAGSQYPVNVGSMGQFAILVRAEDADRAREVLEVASPPLQDDD